MRMTQVPSTNVTLFILLQKNEVRSKKLKTVLKVSDYSIFGMNVPSYAEFDIIVILW
jgi:hypothetical protein